MCFFKKLIFKKKNKQTTKQNKHFILHSVRCLHKFKCVIFSFLFLVKAFQLISVIERYSQGQIRKVLTHVSETKQKRVLCNDMLLDLSMRGIKYELCILLLPSGFCYIHCYQIPCVLTPCFFFVK